MRKIPELWLRRGGDRRLRGGHCWLYSNEVDTARSPLGGFNSGDEVTIRAADGEALGSACMEPQSLICARRYSEAPDRRLDQAFIAERLEQALSLRRRFFDEPYYRLVYGDSDGLSGVVVDRYGDYLVLQLNTAGIERHEQALVRALCEQLQPAGILLRADSRSRREQGLVERVEVVSGVVPDQVPVRENSVEFLAPVTTGQKTGWFYDHRANRARLADYVGGGRVLDVYCYAGAWGLQAAAAGAESVCCVDSSASAIAGVAQNAGLNGFEDRLDARRGEAAKVMQQMVEAGESYDLVILDPPAFIQRKRDLGKGRKAYQRINELALRLLAPGGVLVSASCSMHLEMADLLELLRAASRRTGTVMQVVELGHQARDHPVHPAIPETAYLKAVFAVVSPAG